MCISLDDSNNTIGISTNKLEEDGKGVNLLNTKYISINKSFDILKKTIKIFLGPVKSTKDFICPILLNYDTYIGLVGKNYDEHL